MSVVCGTLLLCSAAAGNGCALQQSYIVVFKHSKKLGLKVFCMQLHAQGVTTVHSITCCLWYAFGSRWWVAFWTPPRQPAAAAMVVCLVFVGKPWIYGITLEAWIFTTLQSQSWHFILAKAQIASNINGTFDGGGTIGDGFGCLLTAAQWCVTGDMLVERWHTATGTITWPAPPIREELCLWHFIN